MTLALLFALPAPSEPEAGGGGGRALVGGGEGSGGAFSSSPSYLGLFDLGDEWILFWLLPLLFALRLRTAARGYDAERGRGAYVLPSLRMSLVGLGDGLVFGTGTSSATSMTGLRHIPKSGVRLSAVCAVGDMGVYDVGSSASVAWDGTGEIGLWVDCVTFFQLATLDALAWLAAEGARSGFGRRSGMVICGRIFFSVCRVT